MTKEQKDSEIYKCNRHFSYICKEEKQGSSYEQIKKQ